MDLLLSLNEKQKDAVTTKEGPLLILAGPGSGKTKTLTHRIAYLISAGVSPGNILAVTFTNKAANEMREKIIRLISQDYGEFKTPINSYPDTGTFHSVCARIIRNEAPALGISRDFIIYDDADQLSVIKKAMSELEIDIKQLSPQKVRSAISGAKDKLVTPELYKAQESGYPAAEIAKVYELYEEKLSLNGGLDFGDLILKTVLLFENNPSILKKYQKKYRYILVDEYQDTNTAQYSLINLLARESENLCVVGDDAQAIYSWRNADFTNILNFKKDWPNAKVVTLEQNYRSTKNIVKAASELIKNNSRGYPKDLWTSKEEGEPVYIKEVYDSYSEAEFILRKINKLASQKKYKLGDFVVLYRTNAQSRAIEEMFLRSGTPYKIVGGVKFYQRREIKDMIAWLRLAVNENDEASRERLKNIPLALLKARLFTTAPTKSAAIEILRGELALKLRENLKLREFMEYAAHKTNFEQILKDGTEQGDERWENILELFSVAEDYSSLDLKTGLLKFLEDISLMQEADQISNRSDLVHLMTLHMAKGLEFPVVFIAGCEEGILPHINSMFSQDDLEEERRLFYVGLTRAKDAVYCLTARQRMIWGAMANNPPSSFLYEIPADYKEVQLLEPDDEESDEEEGEETDYLLDDDDVIQL